MVDRGLGLLALDAHILQVADGDAALASDRRELDEVAADEEPVLVVAHDAFAEGLVALVLDLVDDGDLAVGGGVPEVQATGRQLSPTSWE